MLALSLAVVGMTSLGMAPAQAAQTPHDVVVSDNPAGFTPHVLDGDVLAVAVVGNKVVLGGDFTSAQNASGGAVLTRNRILAFDRTTGVIDTAFAPVLDGKVRTLAPSADGTAVFVGGQFSKLNGATSYKVTKINISNGQQVTAFKPGLVNALVYDLKLVGQRLFIAGQFTQVAGQPRSLLAELDAVTGALKGGSGPTFSGTHNGGTPHIYKFDLNPDGTTLTAVGNFTTVGGEPRVQAVMLDVAGTAALTDWRTTRYEPQCYSVFEYYVRDIEYSPDGEYFVISTTGGYGSGPPTLCDTATRWDADARGLAVDPEWVAYTGGDSSYAVAVTGPAIYIGGHQRWWNNPFAADAAGQGAVSREGIGALDPLNGLPLSWNPTRDRGRGVFDMVSTTDGLWVGSDTDRIGNGEYHGRIAFFPIAGGTAVPRPDPASLPVDAYVVESVEAAAPADDAVTRWAFDGDTPGAVTPVESGGVDWSTVTGGFWLAGDLYLAFADGTFTVRAYDGTTFGPASVLELYGLTDFQSELGQLTGLFYSDGSIFFTLANDPNMYQRYFTVESGIVGAQRFLVAGGGVDWSAAQGMFLSDSGLFWAATASGDLHRVTFTDGAVQAGTDTVVSGPASDGRDWRGTAMFALDQMGPVASVIEYVGSAQHSVNTSASKRSVTLPAAISAGDQLVLTMSFNSGTVTATDPASWIRAGQSQTSSLTTIVWTKSAGSSAASSTVSVTTSASVKSALVVSAYRAATVASVSVARETVNRAAHTTPVATAEAGSWVVSYWTDKTGATTSWTPPAGEQVRQTGAGSGAGHVSWLLTDSGAGVQGGSVGGRTATASSSTASAGMVTVVLAPAGLVR